jgi:hypothetical protein
MGRRCGVFHAKPYCWLPGHVKERSEQDHAKRRLHTVHRCEMAAVQTNRSRVFCDLRNETG